MLSRELHGYTRRDQGGLFLLFWMETFGQVKNSYDIESRILLFKEVDIRTHTHSESSFLLSAWVRTERGDQTQASCSRCYYASWIHVTPTDARELPCLEPILALFMYFYIICYYCYYLAKFFRGFPPFLPFALPLLEAGKNLWSVSLDWVLS